MKIEVDISPEDLSNIVRNDLIESYDDCFYNGDQIADGSIIDSLITVIEWYSSKSSFEDFKTSRGIK